MPNSKLQSFYKATDNVTNAYFVATVASGIIAFAHSQYPNIDKLNFEQAKDEFNRVTLDRDKLIFHWAAGSLFATGMFTSMVLSKLSLEEALRRGSQSSNN